MATQGAIPGFFEKRGLIYAAQPNGAALRSAGQTALGAGLLESALEFFVRAGDGAGIKQVAEAARGRGDAFGLEAAAKALGAPPTHAEWADLGEKALAEGMLWFAYRAFEKAEHQDGLERTRRAMFQAGIALEAR